MRLSGRPDSEHLTYCTNVHPGEDFAAMTDTLRRYVPAVKTKLVHDRPFGVGLRLAASAAATLTAAAPLRELQDLLAAEDCYVFTINGFPFGTFHGRRVKEQVYRPDWGEQDRLVYTNRLADILVRLLPDGIAGSISTVPLCFRPLAQGRLGVITDNLLSHAAHLAVLREETGREVALALEPEPCCYLETIEETRDYFEEYLFTRKALAKFSEASRLSSAKAEEALRRHIGVCYDVCHAAVEFEDATASVETLRNAGIAIPKLQLSSAIRIPALTDETARALGPFDEPVYLHQVVERQNGVLKRYLDLPEALANASGGFGAEWRVHFHVPVFERDLEHFSTTQDFLTEVLALHHAKPISDHLEVETYTWDVLPEAMRAGDLSAAIARELAWVCDKLAA